VLPTLHGELPALDAGEGRCCLRGRRVLLVIRIEGDSCPRRCGSPPDCLLGFVLRYLGDLVGRGGQTYCLRWRHSAVEALAAFRLTMPQHKPPRLMFQGREVPYALFLALMCGLLLGLGSTAARGQKVEKAVTSRKLVTEVQPDYPADLKRARIGGVVRLNIVVSPRGSVDFVEVAGGNPILAESATRAVKQWKYAPASSTTNIRINIHFDPDAR
jgi:TonB family protein